MSEKETSGADQSASTQPKHGSTMITNESGEASQSAPTFPKGKASSFLQKDIESAIQVHRDNLSIDTLRYCNLPWEHDPNTNTSSKTDSDYVIIMREMKPRKTDILFEHTKRLRNHSSQLPIEGREYNVDPERPDIRWDCPTAELIASVSALKSQTTLTRESAKVFIESLGMSDLSKWRTVLQRHYVVRTDKSLFKMPLEARCVAHVVLGVLSTEILDGCAVFETGLEGKALEDKCLEMNGSVGRCLGLRDRFNEVHKAVNALAIELKGTIAAEKGLWSM